MADMHFARGFLGTPHRSYVARSYFRHAFGGLATVSFLWQRRAERLGRSVTATSGRRFEPRPPTRRWLEIDNPAALLHGMGALAERWLEIILFYCNGYPLSLCPFDPFCEWLF